LLQYTLVDEKAGKFEVRPDLAENLEQVNARTYVLRLRQGVNYHDGSPLDAEAAKWNLDRARTHPRSPSNTMLEGVQSVEVVNGNTIRVNLKAPNVSLPVLLTRAAPSIAPMVSRAAVENLGDEGFAAKGVGTGPMEIALWEREKRLLLKRWDGYWGKGADGTAVGGAGLLRGGLQPGKRTVPERQVAPGRPVRP
jgi:ABC-type transport system substrate-binding protein